MIHCLLPKNDLTEHLVQINETEPKWIKSNWIILKTPTRNGGPQITAAYQQINACCSVNIVLLFKTIIQNHSIIIQGNIPRIPVRQWEYCSPKNRITPQIVLNPYHQCISQDAFPSKCQKTWINLAQDQSPLAPKAGEKLMGSLVIMIHLLNPGTQ